VKTTAKQRVLAALRAGTKTTADLCAPDVGGVRFSARLMELRDDGHIIEDHPIRQGSWKYTLVNEARTPLAVVPSPAPLPPVSSRGAWGSFSCCHACGFVFHERGMSRECPSCHEGMQWVGDYWTHADAARAAAQVDPAQVAAERGAHAARLAAPKALAA
jgi:hypothetical protein